MGVIVFHQAVVAEETNVDKAQEFVATIFIFVVTFKYLQDLMAK
jgi:hypothetical protein